MLSYLKNFLNKGRPFFKRSKQDSAIVQKKFDVKLVGRLLPKKIPSWDQFKHLYKFLTPAEKKIISALLIIIVLSTLSWLGMLALKHRVMIPGEGGEYTEGLVGYPATINPLFATLNPIDADLSRLIYAGLFKYDESLNLVPDLAEKYTLDKEGKNYTITLKPNLHWQDGEPITVDDVVFTLNLIQNPETKSPLLYSFENIKFEKNDDQTFTLTLDQPFAPFINLLTTGVLPEHLWQEVPPTNIKFSSLNLKPIGAGPFIFNAISKDNRGNIKSYTLKTNPYYHLPKPYLQTVTLKFFPDTTTALEALRNRQIQGLGLIPKDQKEKIGKNNHLFSLRLSQYTALFLNQKNNLLLKSKELRQALSLAISQSQIINDSLKGEGAPLGGPIPAGLPGFAQNFQTDQNLLQANQILDNDKWKKISREEFLEKRKTELYNTWLEQKKAQAKAAGQENKKLTPEEQEKFNQEKQEFLDKTAAELEANLSPVQTMFREKNSYGLTLSITALNHPEFAQTANLLKQWWQDLGVQVTVNLEEPSQIHKIIRDRSFEVLLYGVVVGSDPDPYPFWHSSQIVNPGLNLAGYANRQADELLEKARQTSDRAERNNLYQNFQKLLAADLPAIFLYNSTYLYAMDNAVKGIEMYRLFQPADRFNNITSWYIKMKSGWQ